MRGLGELGPGAVAAALVLASCGNDASSNDSAPADAVLSESRVVEAAVGGTLELEDGARLTLSVEALSQDTEVTLRRETCSGVYQAPSFGGCLYTVSLAEALKQGGRVELELPVRETTSAQSCLLAQGGGDWRCLGDSAGVERSVHGSASQGGEFSTRVAPIDAPRLQGCFDAEFSACGGDPTGSWRLVRGCGTMQQIVGASFSGGTDPYASCEPHSARESLDYSIEGDLLFETNGQWSWQHSDRVLKQSVVTVECLQQVGAECTGTVTAGVCEQSIIKSQGTGGGGGEWHIDTHGSLWRDETLTPYCVDGDRLLLQPSDATGAPYLLIFERSSSVLTVPDSPGE